MKTALYTFLALLAFAGNSVLCRIALGDGLIDAGSFTQIRLVSGVITLAVILLLSQAYRQRTPADEVQKSPALPLMQTGSWIAGSCLFIYAVGFSYAYLSLDTGTGALVLFGAVQISMIIYSLSTGNRLSLYQWIGVITAFCGFVYLVIPNVSQPSMNGFILMVIAGIAWAGYTLLGQRKSAQCAADPLQATTANFIRTLPLAGLLLLFSLANAELTPKGTLLAVLSGSVASGIGYTLWYAALRGLSSIQAGVLQLFVPAIAAIGGVIFANESLTLRLSLASMAILGGVLLVIIGKPHSRRT